ELARFYDQELIFGPCAGYATTGADEQLFASDPRFECARLEVPLDYDDPGGATAQVAMLRVPARGESIGSLLLNSGGPGGTGMNFAAGVAGNLAQSPVTERFDLIGFDPRGVGATFPAIDCFPDEQVRAGDAQSEFLISAGTLSEEGARQLVETCAQRSGGEQALAAIATRDTVRDMDVLRATLGEKQLNFFGQSYGTRVGAFYAAEYPRRVRAMVLDDAVGSVISGLYISEAWPMITQGLAELRVGRADTLVQLGQLRGLAGRAEADLTPSRSGSRACR
ncbi:MAG: alpha/beta fold hydrolase, partial [Pseudonocardiaceae bacterium]